MLFTQMLDELLMFSTYCSSAGYCSESSMLSWEFQWGDGGSNSKHIYIYVCTYVHIYIVRLFSEKKFSGLKEKGQESYCR